MRYAVDEYPESTLRQRNARNRYADTTARRARDFRILRKRSGTCRHGTTTEVRYRRGARPSDGEAHETVSPTETVGTVRGTGSFAGADL